MKIGVIGARVSGSYAGLLLSRHGHEVLLFDDTTEKEKPCGGGITCKALRKMPWFDAHPLPHTEITTVRLMTPEGYTSDLLLEHPIKIFSRRSLDSCLRQCAIESGAHFMPEHASSFAKNVKGWSIETAGGAFEVDYLIGADGANSSVRKALIGSYASTDLSLALGYSLPGLHHPGTLLISYQESGFYGYLWSFPHVDHCSVGIFQWLPAAHASDLRRRVEKFIAARYPDAEPEKRFYAARAPCLSRKSLIHQRVCGKNWALLGDAAGFNDPITGEGIYYAFRSAEMLAESFRRKDPSTYEIAWRSDFGADLESAAVWRERFYGGMVLNNTFIRRSLQSIRYSRTVRKSLDDLICGNISYNALFRRLALRSPQILLQIFSSRAKKMTNYE